MRGRGFSAALALTALLAADPARAAGPVDPKTKKPYGDPADGPPRRDPDLSDLVRQKNAAMQAEIKAEHDREVAAARQAATQSFGQATSGPSARRFALQAEAIKIRDRLKTATGAERGALAKRVSELLTEAKQLPKQVRVHGP